MNGKRQLAIVKIDGLRPSKYNNAPPYQAVIFKDPSTNKSFKMWLDQKSDDDFNWNRWQPYLGLGYVLSVEVNQNGNVDSWGNVERVFSKKI